MARHAVYRRVGFHARCTHVCNCTGLVSLLTIGPRYSL
jgi:hypothetical protein